MDIILVVNKIMFNGFDISTAQGIYLGGNQVQSLYLGNAKIWPTTHDYSQDYLTIERINNAQGFEIEYDIKGTGTLQRSPDGGLNWYNFESTHGRMFFTDSKVLIKGNITPSWGTVTLDLKRYGGDISSVKVYGNPLSIIYGDNFAGQSLSGLDCAFSGLFKHNTSADSCLVDASNLYLNFVLSNNCYSGMFGDCSNLINPPELPATTLAQSCYAGMFQNCTSLTTAPELPTITLSPNCYEGMFQGCTSLVTPPELPAPSLTNHCYQAMFQGCTSLTTAPELPATSLAFYCYINMFKGCTSLTVAPALPATYLATYCYGYMFQGCTSLRNAPELPASILASSCYEEMFSGCTNLNYIKCLATDISANYCTTNWLYNVSSTGIFFKDASMQNWTVGADGIPSGWTIIYTD